MHDFDPQSCSRVRCVLKKGGEEGPAWPFLTLLLSALLEKTLEAFQNRVRAYFAAFSLNALNETRR